MAHAQGLRSRWEGAGRSQRGYALLTLLLTVSLAVIATALAASTIAFEIRRDREEEMIHRGVQYSRAIRSYAKKTGHYPMDIHELLDAHGALQHRGQQRDHADPEQMRTARSPPPRQPGPRGGPLPRSRARPRAAPGLVFDLEVGLSHGLSLGSPVPAPR